MTIDQSTGYLYVGGWRGYKTINLANHSISNCSYSTQMNRAYGSAIANGKIVYSYANYLWTHNLSTSGSRCPSTSQSARVSYRSGSYTGCNLIQIIIKNCGLYLGH